MKVTDGKSNLVASKKTKKKAFSFNGHSETKYVVKVRGINGKKAGKWSAKKTVTTGKSAAQQAAEQKVADAEKKAQEAKAAQEAAEAKAAEAKAAQEKAEAEAAAAKTAKEQAEAEAAAAKEAAEQAAADAAAAKEAADKAVAEAQAAQKAAEKAAKDANDALDMVIAIDNIWDMEDDEVLALQAKFYDDEQFSPEARALVPEDYVDRLNIEANGINKDVTDNLKAEILALPQPGNVETWDAEDIEAARAHYEALTDAQKMIIIADGIIESKLLPCERALGVAELEAYVDPDDYYKKDAEAVEDIIKAAAEDLMDANDPEEISAIVEAAMLDINEVPTMVETIQKAIDDLYAKYEVEGEVVIPEADLDDVVAEAGDIEERIHVDLDEEQQELIDREKLDAIEYALGEMDLDVYKILAKRILNESVSEEDYYNDEEPGFDWDDVCGIINDAEEEIDKAKDQKGVDDALIAAYKDIAEVPTKLDRVEAAIDDLYEDYSEFIPAKDLDEVKEAVADIDEAIEEDLTEDQYYAFVESDQADELEVIRANIKKVDLNGAKEEAIGELDDIYDDSCENGDYYDAELEDIYDIIYDDETGFVKEINDQESIEGVNAALEAAKKAIDKVATKTDVEEENIDALYKAYYDESKAKVVIKDEDAYNDAKGRAEGIEEAIEVGELNISEEAAEQLEEIEEAISAYELKVNKAEAKRIAGMIAEINTSRPTMDQRDAILDAAEAYNDADKDVKAIVDADYADESALLEDALDALDDEWSGIVKEMIARLDVDKENIEDSEEAYMDAFGELTWYLREAENYGWDTSSMDTYLDQMDDILEQIQAYDPDFDPEDN